MDSAIDIFWSKKEHFVDGIQSYLDSLPSDTRNAVGEIRMCIKAIVPSCEELLNYNILAFALVPNGKRDRQIMVAGYKKHVGFYPSPETISHFSVEIADYKSAKGSLQFPLSEPMPLELITRMVEHRVKQIG